MNKKSRDLGPYYFFILIILSIAIKLMAPIFQRTWEFTNSYGEKTIIKGKLIAIGGINYTFYIFRLNTGKYLVIDKETGEKIHVWQCKEAICYPNNSSLSKEEWISLFRNWSKHDSSMDKLARKYDELIE